MMTRFKAFIAVFWAKKAVRWPSMGLFGVASVLWLWSVLLDTPPASLSAVTTAAAQGQAVLTDSIVRVVTWHTRGGVVGAVAGDYREAGQRFLSLGGQTQAPAATVAGFGQELTAFLKTTQADIFLLQGVDQKAKRSHYTDFVALAQQTLPHFSSCFVANEGPRWGLHPIFEPWHFYGSTQSGMLSLSRFQATQTEVKTADAAQGVRSALTIQHFPYRQTKVSIVHLHNAVEGQNAPQILSELKQIVISLYEKGHYVIVGGSFRRCPPFLSYDAFMPSSVEKVFQASIEPDFMPEGWSFLYDPVNTTCRRAESRYTKGQTFEWVSDFFLVSPNVLGKRVNVVPLDFEWSAHQPVLGTFELLP